MLTAARPAAHPARWRVRLAWLLLPALLLALLTLAVMLGPVTIPAHTVWSVLLYRAGLGEGLRAALGLLPPDAWTPAQEQIIWALRLPRALLGLTVGAGLAVAGCVMQALVRNPLADPYLLGVSSGASAGAVLALSTGVLVFAGHYQVPLAAFGGALLSLSLVFALARSRRGQTPMRLVLSGVAVAYLFSGLTSLLTVTAHDRDLARNALSWLLGSLAGASWSDVGLTAGVVLALTLALTLQARQLNALAFGDETALTLGLSVPVYRRALFVAVSLLAAVIVSVSGAIGFVGLILPHTIRLLTEANHRAVLPLSALAGGGFLVLMDLAGRLLFAPSEVPLGVMTSLLGAPFFLWLLHARSGEAR